jgi:UDP-2,3-diacylglucosamine pyrophosphatase LpxH
MDAAMRDGVNRPGDSIILPESDPDLLPPGDDAPELERAYFAPERWDAEVANHLAPDDTDPVAAGRGRLEGRARAVLFLSDLHLSDGSAGGDDFLESHLRPEEAFGGLQAGFFPPGRSRADVLVSVLTFALRHAGPELDVVLNGDVIDFLALKGRGGGYVSRRHLPLFRALARLSERGTAVYWLRGNHDYVVPTGPWHAGEFYVNPGLQVLAEHGDRWDETNWPPGPASKGARLVLEAAASFAVHAGVDDEGTIRYLMSGLDNVRPLSDDAINGFLDRRAKYSDAAAITAAMSRLKFVGSADDSAAFKGARQRRKKEYPDWLMVQGHTHVPAAVPGVYYNLGTWMTTLVAIKRREVLVEAFPFVLVSCGADSRRVEEYFLVRREAPDAPPKAVLQSPEMVDEFRRSIGYKPCDH